MYNRFGKAFYLLSLNLFIFCLLYFYSGMPEKIRYSFDQTGNTADYISKSSFFYGAVIFFIVMNMLVLLPPKLLETKNHKGLMRIFPIGDSYRDYYLGWFYSFGAILNGSLATLVYFTFSINNYYDAQASDYNFLYFLIPGLFILWGIGLVAILVGKFQQVKNNS